MPSHWVIVSPSGFTNTLLHTLRKNDGNWQGWADVFAATKWWPPGGTWVISTTLHTDLNDNLHVCVLANDGKIWHTIRSPNGNWQSWFNVNLKSSGLPAGVNALASSVSDDNTFQLCAVTNTGVYHTVRQPNGSWQSTWGKLKNPPSPANTLIGG
jgi:hypothetical protein